MALYGVLFMMGADMFLIPMLIPTIADSLRTDVARTAYIVAAFGAAYAISSPLVTGLLHSRSSRAVIGGGLCIVVCACVTAVLTTDLAMLVLARAASGLGAAIVNPAVWSRLQATAPPPVAGRVMLGGTAVSAAGQVVGIPLGTMLAAYGGWRLAFGVLALGFAATWVATRAALAPDPISAASGVGVRGSLGGALDGLRLWRVPTFSFAVVGNIAAQAARLGTYSYVAALFAKRYALHGTALGIVGIVAGTGALVGALIATAVVSWWCRRGLPVLGFSVASTSIMFVGIALVTAPTSVQASLVGLGLSFAAGITIFGTGQFYLTSAFVGDRTAISWNSSAMHIGAAVGTLVLGLTNLDSAAFMTVSLSFVVIAGLSCSIPVAMANRQLRTSRSH